MGPVERLDITMIDSVSETFLTAATPTSGRASRGFDTETPSGSQAAGHPL